MDRDIYNSKVQELLGNVNTYSGLKKDQTQSIQRKMNLIISKFEKLNRIHSGSASQLKCYTGLVQGFYGLPKLHKPNVPLRPIIDFSRSPLYKLSRYLSALLKPLS